MRKLIFLSAILLIVGTLAAFKIPNQVGVQGAWSAISGTNEEVLVFQDNYFSYTNFDKANKKFIRTYGGTAVVNESNLEIVIEFDTQNTDAIGTKKTIPFSIEKQSLKVNLGSNPASWQRVDDGKGPLAGNWRISGRQNNGQWVKIQRADRKTLKLLSSTRFQWMAINPATKEFFGTGGGTYTFENGVYTEHIEFFSRDSSRVGASLSFQGKVNGDEWEHSGKSSKGDPLQEVWARDK